MISLLLSRVITFILSIIVLIMACNAIALKNVAPTNYPSDCLEENYQEEVKSEELYPEEFYQGGIYHKRLPSK